MNTSTAATLNPPDRDYTAWRDQVRTFFAQKDEFDLASAIYPFATRFEEGMTAKEAFAAFDKWAIADV